MSKLSQLKQDAYQAGKKKDWDQAVSIYEKILDLEKNNPTVINEMGDLCLKAGESSRAVSHFLKAASKYRKTGLLNNAVAIYKKILRHDEENLNAHWYLASTRASQGLIQEGEQNGLHFLKSSEEVSGELKEIFLGRCRELFELYPESQPLQEQLLKIFRTWDMPIEASRCLCLLACIQFSAGNEDDAQQGMEEVSSRTPEIINYPEYTKWNNLVNPTADTGGAFVDFGEVKLGEEDSAKAEVPVEVQPSVDLETASSSPIVPANDPGETSFGDLQVEVENINTQDEDAEVPADDDGYLTLDAEDSTNFDDLIAQAADQVDGAQEPSDTIETIPVEESTVESGQGASMDSLLDDVDHSKTGDVDLLAEILAEDSPDSGNSDADQLDTITKEIGAQVGGDDGDDDADRMYEMGLVYLEMGLFDQACDSLAKAVQDPEYAVRSYETWGTALCRNNRPDEAVEVLTKGLEHAEAGSHSYLGLLYHIGKAHEQAGRADEATSFYEKIQGEDRSFLDVGKRLANLTTV